jgi:hypothetical protein
MRVVGVIDLKAGTAVHAVRGERESYRPVSSVIGGDDGDAVALARGFRSELGLDELYVADLDAIVGDGENSARIGVLAREALSRDRAGGLYSESLANILAVHLLRNYAMGISGDALEPSALAEKQGSPISAATAGHPRAVAEALQFIQQNYAHELSLSNIAAAVSLSPFHLTRLFKRTLGISLYQHVLQVRVNSARSLLAASPAARSCPRTR